MKTTLSVCQKLFFCAVGLLMLCGFEAGPDCKSDDIKRTVIGIVKQHPPEHLLAVAGDAWSAKQKEDIEKECGKTYTEECTRPALETLAQKQLQMGQAATYNIDNIRMTDKNETTGAVSCTAVLHVVLPEYWGSADEPITYLVEKYLGKGGGFNVTLHGLH
ncbi:MAG: hypothetical protein ACHQRJ_03670 [Alphaproteobacteria bacterium]